MTKGNVRGIASNYLPEELSGQYSPQYHDCIAASGF